LAVQATEASRVSTRGTARAPGAEAKAAARQDMAAETVRGESARLSCPLHSEAVPSWDYALIFSGPNTGWKSGEAFPAVVAGSLHGKVVLSR
jgi:hypothetical protein